MSNTGYTVTSPNTGYSYAIQSGDGGVDGVDSWNPDEFTAGDQHYGSISGRDQNSQFGRGLDTDFEGERIVGGGPNWNSGQGYIQIYDWSESSSTWTSLQQINGPSAGGWFGESVSMDYDGERIIVGAPKINTVYVYDIGNNNLFTLVQTISTGYDSFGHCVSIAGDRADRFVVGAPNVNTIYVYERQASGQFTQVYSNSGTNMVNDVPVTFNGTLRLTLYSKFNGYGYSVKMSGFGGHIVVGAPGTEIAEIQSSGHAGTTTPGNVSHHLGEHTISTVGPHWTGSYSFSCNTQQGPGSGNVSAGNPYSVYKYSTSNSPANPLRYPDSQSNIYHPDRSPYGANVMSGAQDAHDGFIFPNFQVGNIRVLKCPDGGSWSATVTQIGSDIKGRNPDGYTYLDAWNCIYSSLPGFGRSVSISVDGKRVSAGSPGYKDVSYNLQAAHGDTRYFVLNKDSSAYDEPMASRDENTTPSLGGPWSFVRENATWASWNISMSEDGSRLFVGSRESSYSIIPYDFSGTTFYPAAPIVRTGGAGAGPNTTKFGTTAHTPNILGGKGYLSGYRSAAHNGASCVISHPAYPEGFGISSGPGDLATPATNNGRGTGRIVIYRYRLTSVFRGNSLFEGYVKCDNLTVGSSGGSVDHARIKFGGRKGENTTEAATTLESRWLGTHDAVYTGSTSATGYKHDNELLISKFYSELHTPFGDTVKDADWNKRDFFGDRVRIKAPKIEFQLQSAQSQQANQKYRESPCVSITDMNNPFGSERGMTYFPGTSNYNALANEPRQLVSIRTGTSNSRVQAGLRLIAGSSAGFVGGSSAAEALNSAIPSDGDMYTFAPGNDGWLRLLCPVGQGNSSTYETETNHENSQTITSKYAGMAVGDLYIGGSMSGPGASAAGSTVWSTPASGNGIYYLDNVGIGSTSTPSYKLDVTGDINFTGEMRKNGVVQSFGGGGGTGGLDANGVLSISKNGEVARFQPATNSEYTLVNFNSKISSGSDRGFILVQDETANSPGTAGEDLRMTIGVFNDFRNTTSHSDELWFQGGGRLVYNIGSWPIEYNTIIGTPNVGTAHGGLKHEWRINDAEVMTLKTNASLAHTTNPQGSCLNCRQFGVGTVFHTPQWGITLRGNTTSGMASQADLNAIVSHAPVSSSAGGFLMALDDKVSGAATINLMVDHANWNQYTGQGADGIQIAYLGSGYGSQARSLVFRHLASQGGETPDFTYAMAISNASNKRGHIGIDANPSTSYKVYISGNIYATSGGVLSSDDRIKYNEQTVDNCLNIINKLTPLKYEKLLKQRNKHSVNLGTWIPTDHEWTSVKSDYEWIDEYGFIAQDVKNISELAFLVTGSETEYESDVIDKVAYSRLSSEEREKYTIQGDDSYIHVDSGETQTPLGLNYGGIFTIAVGAIQDLDRQLQTERVKVQTLQTRLTASEQAYQSLLERVVALESA